jgi:hypothetical protein
VKIAGALALATLVASGCAETGPTTEATSATTTAAPAGGPPEPTRMMPLGDSITQADAEHDSYRRPLWRALRAAGRSVDFVGSQRAHHRGGPPNPDFDLDHEGHWGWRVDEILERLPRWVADHEPDVLLVHLGSNDLFQGESVESTLGELEALVAAVRAVEPEAVLLLAQILTTTTEAANRRIRELNARLPDLAARLTTPASPVLVVDHASGFDPARMTYDGVHPNLEGEAHMAERWLDGLAEILP